jgi:hypothetical protein
MKEDNWGKAYEIKVWCYWEHLGEHIGNLMGGGGAGGPPPPRQTRNQKIQYPPSPPFPQKEKTLGFLGACCRLIRIPIPSFVCLSPFSS